MDSAHPELDPAAFVKTLTHSPGVYRMLGPGGEVLYVGKARDLRKRLASYVRDPAGLAPKTRALMAAAVSIEVTVTHTETEALLLESNLIKEHRPRYNVLLRDDKSFPYIHVSTEHEFPRLAFHRGPRRGRGRYFGPYASAGATRATLALLQKLFQVRQCEESFFANRSRPCLQHQIRRCTAPCVGLVDRERYAEDVRHALLFLEGKSDEVVADLVRRMERAAGDLDYEMAARYRDQIASLRQVQARQHVSTARGDVDAVGAFVRDGVGVVDVIVIRGGHSLGSRTILARHVRDATPAELVGAFLTQHYLTGAGRESVPREILVSHDPGDTEAIARTLSERSGRRVEIRHRVRGERARWIEMALANAEVSARQRLADRSSLAARLEALAEALGLPEAPRRIECFDVSHTAGEATVASCVVFEGEGPLKSEYRRFNVRDVEPGDDYAAMEQVLRRRYTRVQREEGAVPDLILVDGGRGQLARAERVLEELQLGGVSLAAVAKGPDRRPGQETILVSGRERPVMLDPGSGALLLVQQVRDEAHRFAITGHRQRRSRARGTSVLERIPGVGATRRRRLLSEFGGLQGVSRAGVEDLARVSGISRGLAQAIYDAFHEAR